MKKIALFANYDKPDAIKWSQYAAEKLSKLGAECCADISLIEQYDDPSKKILEPYKPEEFERFADIVISFGGDGTMLTAARSLLNTSIPIMGVNVGKLGFLAEFSVENLDQSLQNIMDGNYRVIDRAVFKTFLNEEQIFALNDFVIEKRYSSRIITISVFANDHHIGDYRADGVILTTPTGSTAYNLSCGGPVIAPTTEVMCITPISPHMMTLRPLVIPDSNEVKMIVHSPTGEASLVADGQIERIVKTGSTITINRSESIVKLIKPLDSSYYDLLRNKLLWAVNAVK
jgi:NAD+ kinase